MNQTKATLEAINHQVNENVNYVSDMKQYHSIDKWEDATETKMGDCEDYAIAKIRLLLKEGWPKADLRIAIVGVDNPLGDHSVACAKDVDGQWWVLDNRNPFVMLPADVGYTWVRWGMGQTWTKVTLI